MNLSTQLRIILLLVGAAIWLGIYLMGKRNTVPRASMDVSDGDNDAPPTPSATAFAADELDDEELETPAYMRRQGQRESRQDYEPRIANVQDYDDEVTHDGRRFVDIPVHDSQHDVTTDHTDVAPMVATEAAWDDREPTFDVRHEPRLTLDDSFEVSPVAEPHLSAAVLPDLHAPESARIATPSQEAASPKSDVPAPIPVIAEPIVTSYQAPTRAYEHHDAITPTLSDVVRTEQPVMATPVAASTPAPAAAKPANSPARRKIIALRLPIPERVPGAQLLSLLQREQLQHGKFGIFHRMHEANSVFSVASMVEPGTFDPHAMAEQQFPGMTLFMLLPGPLDGLVAYDQMMSCAQRLAHATSGTLQDERGSKLTAQSMDRLRDEVLDFQHLIGGAVTAY